MCFKGGKFNDYIDNFNHKNFIFNQKKVQQHVLFKTTTKNLIVSSFD